MGFRGLISHLDKDPSLLTNVRGLLTKAHTPERFDQHFQDADFKSSTISDAIALSSSLTPGGLQHLFNSIEHLARGLLDLGYFVRCAIVKDRLFHDDKMVLGAGLVRAYLLENTVAKYPRVVVTKDVVDGLGWKNTDSIDLTFVRRSKDGLYFQHVLRFLELVKDKQGEDRTRRLKWITRVRDMIQQRLDEAIDDPTHYEKVFWFADYFNAVFGGVAGAKLVEAPGLTDAAKWGA